MSTNTMDSGNILRAVFDPVDESLQVVLPASQIATITPPTTVVVTQASGTNLHANVDNFPSIQSVSGTVAAEQSGVWNINNIGGVISLPTGAATSANQTNGNQQTQIVQAGRTAAVTAASALKVDNSAVTQPVSGTVGVIQSTSPWISNVTQFGGANISVGTGASGAGVPRVTISNDSNVLATQSGTWTVQQGTPPWYVANTPLDGTKATYSAAILNLSVGSAASDVFTIAGSATKIIRILRVGISIEDGSQANVGIQYIIRSTLNTGGTSSILTNVAYDSHNPPSTAVVRAYTANPSVLGVSVGTIRTRRVPVTPNNIAGINETAEDFGNRPGQALVLRGTAQNFVINLNGASFNNSAICIWIEWTEE